MNGTPDDGEEHRARGPRSVDVAAELGHRPRLVVVGQERRPLVAWVVLERCPERRRWPAPAPPAYSPPTTFSARTRSRTSGSTSSGTYAAGRSVAESQTSPTRQHVRLQRPEAGLVTRPATPCVSGCSSIAASCSMRCLMASIRKPSTPMSSSQNLATSSMLRRDLGVAQVEVGHAVVEVRRSRSGRRARATDLAAAGLELRRLRVRPHVPVVVRGARRRRRPGTTGGRAGCG